MIDPCMSYNVFHIQNVLYFDHLAKFAKCDQHLFLGLCYNKTLIKNN